MIGWLKYLPLELRFLDRNPEADYKILTFRQAKPIRLLAGGNIIRLKAPKHSLFSSKPSTYLRFKDGMDMIFTNYSFAATDNWKESTLLSRGMEYQYSWFRGAKGILTMYMAIVTRAEKKAFGDTSFFHPRSFEFALANFLNTQYGHNHTKGIADAMAPVNWQVHQQLPVFSASFDITGLHERRCYFFPISDKHFVELSFGYIDEGDEKCRNEMKTLAKEIIQSVTLELGSQSQAQWDRVKAECPNMSLSESFAPLQWPIKPEDIEKPPVVMPFIAPTEQLAKQ